MGAEHDTKLGCPCCRLSSALWELGVCWAGKGRELLPMWAPSCRLPPGEQGGSAALAPWLGSALGLCGWQIP